MPAPIQALICDTEATLENSGIHAIPKTEIILVDDDTSILEILQDLLQTYGKVVRIFDDPQEAQRGIMNIHAPITIVSDCNMGGNMSGIDLAKVTLEHRKMHSMIMFILSGTSALPDLQEIDKLLKSRSLDGFFQKPITAKLINQILGVKS